MMTYLKLAVSALALAAAVQVGRPVEEPDAVPATAVAGASMLPPASYAAQDPADPIYREARTALADGRFGDAAGLFGRIVAEHPRSSYAPDALYWQAYSLARAGGDERLRRAASALVRQARDYPRAGTRENGEAEALAARIQGQLARQGDADAAQRVTAAAGSVPGAPCDPQQQEMRVAALNALLNMNADQALPILRQVLERRDECSRGLRERATFMVADTERPEAVDILLDVAANDPAPGVREKAVFWLSEVEDERAVDALIQILGSDADPGLREKAVFALSQHGADRARGALREAALDARLPRDLREKVVFWLGDQEGNADFLKQLYGRLRDDGLREKVLFAMAQSEDAAAADWLIEQAMDSDQPRELRKKALFWAGEADAPMGRMVGLYDRISDREIKEQLIFVFSQREDDDAAVDKLIHIARNEPDRELRKRAVFWLGEIDSPRARQALLDIING